MADPELRHIFETLTAGQDLSRALARAVFVRIMNGDLPEATIGALLGALATKGEAIDELVGAAQAMREAAVKIQCDAPCIDTCGTGGDGISTFNVSTTAGIIAAAAGAVVAKHGNRSTTRASGSTEVLAMLGIDVDAPAAIVERCLNEVGIGYLNARQLHPAMMHAAPVRQSIPVRTIFNLLGPLTNPAGARRQILGVPRVELTEKMAQALLRLGAQHAWVVHGRDGLCDLTITGATAVVVVRDGRMSRFSVTPEEAGLQRGSLDELRIDTPQQSARMALDVLEGKRGTPRDHAVLNAGAALVVAGQVDALPDGVSRAADAIDSGEARGILRRWREIGGIPATDGGGGAAP